ncbi:pyridoxamine 5'-phosphate oxidase [Streptomyces nigrescens]
MAEMSGADDSGEDTGGEAGPGATAGVGGAAGSGATAGPGGAAGPAGAAGVGGASGAAGPDCPEAIRRALAAHTTMTLAYVDEDGPQACAVLYATGVASGVASGAEHGGAAGMEAGGPSGGASGVASGVAGAGAVGAGPALYFVTATTTRHGRALVEPGARVAFTVQRDGQEWSGLTGLQGRGRCRPLTGAERAAGWQVYVERFPFVTASDRLRAALERTTLWELRPDWLRLIDNGQGFGHKEEWSGR